jgi:hypothetical protein
MEHILSFFDFQKKFPDEDACRYYLFRVKWPQGFIFPKCGDVEEGTTEITDGLPSHAFLNAGYQHHSLIVKEHNKSGELLPKVHIVIANLKMWLRDTFNRYPNKHIQSYLNEFCFRFDRRWRVEKIFDKLLSRCILTTTITYAELTG